ncbi:MAG: ATP-grasp domain-containing protein [Spirochaetales bacterium]|nr:ATP-grasp domain-containing protein [Spirochaetales bacterium]
MKRSIVICEYISTGINYIDDARSRGYEPVLVEGSYVGTPEEQAPIRAARDAINKRLAGSVKIICENSDYDEILRQVRETNPVVVVAGSEFGVALATRLAEDLGLPGNPVSRIPAMTEKDAMHEALRKAGIRYIRGKVITDESDAIEYYRSLGKEDVVVKRARGAATQGVYLCHGYDEMLSAVRKSFSQPVTDVNEPVAILMQERIIGTEYIVNTVSCAGRHRVVSVWKYDKVKMPNGANAYNYAMTVPRLEVGHSALVRYACQVADAVGVKYGPIHGEYMVDENGPVLIEVNCRPMGGGLQRKYVEEIFGHHETDVALDSYLDPKKFEEGLSAPYRVRKFGAMKIFITYSETEVDSAPILQISTHLRSFYSAGFDFIGRGRTIPETNSLETCGGQVNLLHEDEKVIREECDLLHLLETKYSGILYQSDRPQENASFPVPDIDAVMKAADCRGATLVFSDTATDVRGAIVADSKTLAGSYDSFEYGILDLSDSRSFADLESVVQQFFVFVSKIRRGGRILIPESTYVHLPYGMEGMEILLKGAGLRIEMPVSGMVSLLVASVE